LFAHHSDDLDEAEALRRPVRLPHALIGGSLVGLLFLALPEIATAAPSVLRPATPQAEEIKSLAIYLFVLSAVILLGVEAVLLYSIVRFRNRPEDEVRQTHGNNTIEAVWTLIPVVLIIIIFTMTVRTMDSLELPGGDVELDVVGHQWWWEVRYPEQQFATANEIHVPEGREVAVRLTSADVIHSFWVPQIGGKTDLVPGHVNRTSFLAATPGTYLGECAEFCGLQHARMRFFLIVESAADFSAWITHQQEDATEPANDAAVRGQQVFLTSSCIGCHTVRGTSAAGIVGPDLTHLAGRLSIGAGTLDYSAENLRRWLEDPQEIKPGNLMPTPELDPQALDDLVAYLDGLE
jgi:cytochrome c oxidase subunit 2